MTPIKFIRKIVVDRMKLFKLFSVIYTIPLIAYIILDLFKFEFSYRIAIATILLLIIRSIFANHLKSNDFEVLTAANDKIDEESHELAMLLVQNKMYKDNHLKRAIIEMGKILENENDDETQ